MHYIATGIEEAEVMQIGTFAVIVVRFDLSHGPVPVQLNRSEVLMIIGSQSFLLESR